MDKRRLTLRLTVRPADEASLPKIEEVLRAAGLEVVSARPNALTLAAPADSITRFFGAHVEVDDQGARFSTEPTYGGLPTRHSYSTYFPTKPTFY
jgi:hypothetical protein